jgi:hypothetical protein
MIGFGTSCALKVVNFDTRQGGHGDFTRSGAK